MTVLERVKAFFKRKKPEAEGTQKKVAERSETKAAEIPEKKVES